MKRRTYRVKFTNTRTEPPRSRIEAYGDLANAKKAVARTNSATIRHGITAEYLGSRD